MIDNHKIADLADRAANEIDVRGHAKGVFNDPETGGVCARGAVITAILGRPLTGMDILFASGELMNEEVVTRAVAEYLNLPDNGSNFPLVAWNNAEERTAEEVTSALRETAASLRLAEVPAVEPVVPAPRTSPENAGV